MALDDLNIVRNPNARISNGNEPVNIATKQTWDKAGFRALRDALKQPGIITIKPWADAPDFEITLDLSGIGALILTGKLSNRMIVEKRKAIGSSGDKLKEVGQKIDDNQELNDADNITEVLNDATTAVLDYHDYILGSIVSNPKYYMMDEIKKMNTLHPDDGLSVFDFDAELRWAIIKVLNEGGEEFQKFRTDPIGYSITLSEQNLLDASGGNVPPPDNAVVDQSTLQSGDLRGGDGQRSGTDTNSDQQVSDETAESATISKRGKSQFIFRYNVR